MNIIQIGTNQGNDHLTSLLQNLDISKLILIEPLDIHNDYIMACYNKYENLHLENIAITSTEDQKELEFFYHINDHPLFEVASIHKEHILKHGYAKHGILDEDGIRSITVKCSTLNNLFNKYNLTNIDILYIDAEGLDDLLIQSIDFNLFNINEIYFEHIHINESDLTNFLKLKGYTITRDIAQFTSLASKIKN